MQITILTRRKFITNVIYVLGSPTLQMYTKEEKKCLVLEECII